MTEQERINREALLRRAAAVAGAVYFAPVLTSIAAAETQECPSFVCKSQKKRKKCRKVGAGKGKTCDCAVGQACHAHVPSCGCTREDPNACSPLEMCGGCGGNGACFQDAQVGGTFGVCVDLRDGFCASFSPCAGTDCPAGQSCFNSCCEMPLCSDCCAGDAAPKKRMKRSVGGAGSLYTDL